MVIWVVYGAYGLGTLPMFLIKGTKSLEETKNEVINRIKIIYIQILWKLSNDLSKIREKQRAIQEKYAQSHSKISKYDQRILNNLKKQERLYYICK